MLRVMYICTRSLVYVISHRYCRVDVIYCIIPLLPGLVLGLSLNIGSKHPC